MKAILIALLVLTLGASGVFAAGPLGDDAGTERTIPLATGPVSSTTTTETGIDVPGPCDEPEHANDPRCAGATTTGTTREGTTTTETRHTTTTETRGTTTTETREAGEDMRGPCDEAEHANDPRCTGGAPADDDRGRRGGNSGPGSSGSGGDDGSGSSGRGGSGSSGSDDSGSGSSGDRGSDDDSRSGSNSGSG